MIQEQPFFLINNEVFEELIAKNNGDIELAKAQVFTQLTYFLEEYVPISSFNQM
jgi:hypothetical protein